VALSGLVLQTITAIVESPTLDDERVEKFITAIAGKVRVGLLFVRLDLWGTP
jgi:hypothetical protein